MENLELWHYLLAKNGKMLILANKIDIMHKNYQ